MKFSEITGNAGAIRRLRHMADSGRLPHALLLCGHPGVGKMMAARAFAAYLCCEHPQDGEACGCCPACRQIADFNYPDIHYVYPVVKRRQRAVSADFLPQWREFVSANPYLPPEAWPEAIEAGNSQPAIYVDESEAILRTASLSAFSARHKIFIIWQPEKMNIEAANKLLKIIEEPFADTMFIFVTDHPELLLPTVYSRTQRVNFDPVEHSALASAVSRICGVDTQTADVAARLGAGSVPAAIQAVSYSEESADFLTLYKDIMRTAYAFNVAQLKTLADKTAEMGREKARRFLNYCSRLTGENYIVNFRCPELNSLSGEEEEFSRRFAPFIHAGNVREAAEGFTQAAADISRNAAAKIVCFDMLLSLAYLLKKPLPERHPY